ncbi:type III polyketide synthase [Leifsonia sp. C5G2]|uniref:type III polyketide synthase n=1 Tax=Leifsonia sp. C5G2 TaxID=2735269 RepID=UPI0015850CEA|nr:type III polyketide synthase [Leifsonia sp. C5G2]
MSRIVSVAPVLPARSYSQGEITAALLAMITSDPARQQVMRRIHASSGVQTRSLVMPLEQYSSLASFQESNDYFIAEGTSLAERAVTAALASAGLQPADVDFLLFTSVTGIATPSIDAQLVSRLGLRPDVKRLPSFGLGCVAGAAGIARVNDYLAGHPDEVAVLLSVELCSLTVQARDDSMANIVASGLFGDGAAAVVMVGDARAEALGLPGPEVVDTRSHIYPDTADVIGWDIGGTGFRIVLSAGVPDVIDRNFADDACGILAAHGLDVDDVGAWAAHPGGPKVLEAFSQALDLPEGALDASWRSLANVGNLSSAAVLHVLAEQLDGYPPDTIGLLFALGPGVTSELVLLRWAEGSRSAERAAAPATATQAVPASLPATLPAAAMIEPTL